MAPRLEQSGRVQVIRVIARLNLGGPAQHVLHLTRELNTEFPTLLVTGSVSADEIEIPLQDPALPVMRMPQLGRRIRLTDDVSVFLELFLLFRRLRPLIVHTHTAKAGVLARIAAVLARVPVRIHTYHGHVFTGYFGRLGSAIVISAERFLARFTSRILAVSESQKRDLSERFRIAPASRVAVMPLGVNLQPFLDAGASERRAARAELGVSGEPVVAIAGRLVPIKNHRLFLRAAAEVLSALPSTVFLIAGDGPERDALQEYARYWGLETRVRFLGWRVDLHRIFAASDVIALSSDNEGTPVALIEALAAGKPVVATDVGGVADLLEQGRLGRLVTPGDASALAEGILAAIREPVNNAARSRVIERFGVARLARDMKDLYRSVLAERDRASTAALQRAP